MSTSTVIVIACALFYLGVFFGFMLGAFFEFADEKGDELDDEISGV